MLKTENLMILVTFLTKIFNRIASIIFSEDPLKPAEDLVEVFISPRLILIFPKFL